MSTSAQDRTPISEESTPTLTDGVLRAMDLPHQDPPDTLTDDRSVAYIFRDATRSGAALHPNRDEVMATVLLPAAANASRTRTPTAGAGAGVDIKNQVWLMPA